MPRLNSAGGVKILHKYISNWYLVLALYANIISKVKVKFRDGFEIDISRRKNEMVKRLSKSYGLPESITWLQNSRNFDTFYEELYKRYLQDNGFSYQINQDLAMVTTPTGISIVIIPPYSFVIDEVFIMKVYGQPKLKGRVAIDVGASIGDSSLYFSSLGATKVYGFELDKERFTIGAKNVKINNLGDKIQLFNEGATAKSLEELILKNNYRNVFVKMDCEGCEYKVIREISQEVSLRITDIVMEYHSDPRPLVRRLRDLSYKVSVNKSIVYAKRRIN